MSIKNFSTNKTIASYIKTLDIPTITASMFNSWNVQCFDVLCNGFVCRTVFDAYTSVAFNLKANVVIKIKKNLILKISQYFTYIA
jgi:hypothetical protein